MHSLHGYFLRPGDTAVPIEYHVERIKDGKAFSSRRVVASQHEKTIFYMSTSYQQPEPGLDHSDPMPTDLVAPEDAPTLASVFEQAIGAEGRGLEQGVGRARRTAGRVEWPAVLDPCRRQASGRTRLACLRSGVCQRPDVARGKLVAARDHHRRPADPAGVAGSRSLVPPAVPGRRVAALRPGLAVGFGGAWFRDRPALQPGRSLDRVGRAGGPDPAYWTRPGLTGSATFGDMIKRAVVTTTPRNVPAR